jgi:hypothetical protein
MESADSLGRVFGPTRRSMDAGASCTTQVSRRANDQNGIAPTQSGQDVDGTHLAHIFELLEAAVLFAGFDNSIGGSLDMDG